MLLRRSLVVGVLAGVAIAAAGCGGDDEADGGGGGSEQSSKPIRIGTSLPLTGEYSEPGKASKEGYEAWQAITNEGGGILGRKVEMVVRDDASKQNVAVADYTNLISQEKVDALLGTFTSILNLPASAVAERNQKVFICPACASPDLFERNFKYLFYAKQATASDEANALIEWIEGLPESERPKTAAYLAQDDPFTGPVIDGIQEKLEPLGIKTVVDEVYPPDTRNFDTLANQVAQEDPDILAQGSLFEDAVGMVRSMIKADYNPRLIFQTSAPALGEQYAEGIGAENTEGVMTATAWDDVLDSPGNKEFVAKYQEMFGQPAGEDAAGAYASAQVLQAAIEAVGSVEDQTALAEWLHENEVETILGTLSWDEVGRPQGTELIAQWQGGDPKILFPEDLATSEEVLYPKPEWGAGGN